MKQQTKEWFEARQECITASDFHTVINGTFKGWASLKKRKIEGSTFTGNAATEHGNLNEPKAIALFEMATLLDVVPHGFTTHPQNEFIGASPDGLIGDNSGIEVKCPFNPDKHIEVMLSREVPQQYVAQVQGNMMVHERDSWHFASYDPRQEPSKRLVHFVVYKDEEYCKRLYDRCCDFLEYWKTETPVDNFFNKKPNPLFDERKFF